MISVTLSCGCGALLPRSKYTVPEVEMPQTWQGENITGAGIAAGDRWWMDFNDPVLSDLIGKALKTNNDLASASIRVRRAQLNAGLADTNLTPSVSVDASASGMRNLENHNDSKSGSVTVAASYELDLWGRLESIRDVSRWEAEASESDRQSVALALIGTTATDYWQIAYLNERIYSAEASVAYAQKTLGLVEVKYNAGAVSGLDMIQARQTLASRKAELTSLLQQRTEARNALVILFDQAPENIVPERKKLPDGPLPKVSSGLPASLLGKRPDLRAAEQRLRKYLANIDSTKASFYPALTLTGSLGSKSTSLADVLQNPYGTLGAGVTLPFIQMNTMKLNVEISKTEYEEAVISFRKALYAAFGDVENALSGRARYEEENKLLKEALDLAKKAEELAEVRYRAGSTELQLWLDAQESRRSAEKNLAENRLNLLKSVLKLYQAIGGGMSDPGSVSSR